MAPNGKAVSLRDLLLIALTFASGAVDAISYFGRGKTFSAFMTGNIVFLGFGIANIKGPAVLPVICALSAFAVGSYLGLQIRRCTPRNLVGGPGRCRSCSLSQRCPRRFSPACG